VLNRIRQHAAVKHPPGPDAHLAVRPQGHREGLGADGYPTKPAQPSTLIDAIQALAD
jgi:hypothetical protein